MQTNIKKEILLEGLCCANCASKIERNVKSIENVHSANLDFISKKLTIEVEDKEKLDEVLNKTEKIVKNIEPDVKVIYYEKKESRTHNHLHEDKDDNKKFIRIGVGAVIFAVNMVFEFSFYTKACFFFISYILIGGDIVLKAFKNIIKGQVFDENFLMAIATIGAFSINQFPEGVAVMLFYQVGEYFQGRAVNSSRKSISELMDIRPHYANLKEKNSVRRVLPEEVSIGDTIVVKPGERIPLDGTVVYGKSMVDTSALTGESLPTDVENGSDVLGGCVNKNGMLLIKVVKEFSESTVSKILDLVENASSKKAPTENFITKFAMYYTPVVVITAMILAIVPPIIIEGATFSKWIYRALVFLVVSCPCALVISIPLSFFGGIGGASKKGILIKGGNYLEALNQVETIVFDKTGTLTKGIFDVTEIYTEMGINKAEVLKYAAFAECYSNHPIAVSILKAYVKEVDKNKIEAYDEIPGHGIKVKIQGKEILAGNDKLMIRESIKYHKVDKSGTIIHVTVNKKYFGYILISDKIKEDAKDAIKSLKSIGIKNIIMLTGDSKIVGEDVARKIEVDKVYSELLPNDKVEKLEKIYKDKSAKGKIIFVGDGINDAPVLARADIGIAMGGLGSDAAIEAADIVIMTDEPSKIFTAIKIAKKTKSIVMQNIAIALGVKSIVLILGTLGIANMWEAVFADVGVALIAVLNSMRSLKV